MIKCTECGKAAVKEIGKYYYWLKMMNFLQFLNDENYIEQATYENLINDLMVLKPEEGN